MALTYRTGSGSNPGKGSALTIEELDNNFRHFTGSHSVTGSLEVSGSVILTGSLDISGSISGSINGSYSQEGSLTISGSLLVSGSGTFDNVGPFNQTGFANFKSLDQSALSVSGSTNLTGSLRVSALGQTPIYFNSLPTSEPATSGQLWLSGSFSSSRYLMVRD
tara:strand:+ start:136 stop:627 length:492 start_codon:yes stop_codon:yes gene_type:complete